MKNDMMKRIQVISEEELTSLFLSPLVDESDYSRRGKIIMAYVYTHYKRFGLFRLDEDSRSEFLLWMYPRFCRVARVYTIGRSKLTTYLNSVIRWSYSDWRRYVQRKDSYVKTIVDYTNDEYQSTYYGEGERYAAYSDSTCHDIIAEPVSHYGTQRITAQKLLVLALKSCLFLEPLHIRSVAKTVGCSERQISTYIQDLLPLFEKRCDGIVKAHERRNLYYVRTRRYRMEMDSLDKATQRYCFCHSRYQFYLTKWKKALHECRTVPRYPANHNIAAILGVKTNVVASILSNFKKCHGEVMKKADGF